MSSARAPTTAGSRRLDASALLFGALVGFRQLREVALFILVALSIASISTPAGAQFRPSPGELPPPGHTRILDVPQTPSAPTIDGNLSDAAWSNAALADRFWINDQERWPTEQTEVLVTSDGQNLYVAFKVYDSQPNEIEAIQSRRDADLGLDDQVTIELDPFLTHRQISTYSVNARGTQRDQLAAGRARQLTWKGDWKAAVKRTDFGWSAEIAIPFEILNYQPGSGRMGINFLRYHHRTVERSRWADTAVRNLPEEMGQLTGLRPSTIARSAPWTFLPYVVVGHNIPDRSGKIGDVRGNTGADIRFEPRPNLTGVFSLLPDFSQVETSITDIDFNYNEKFRTDPRPFFQEGSGDFGDNPAYFYSNRVPDFDYGAKGFGRIDDFQLGGMVTRSPNQRWDTALDIEREFGSTRSASVMYVSSDRPGFSNQLYVLKGQGRESSGLTYAFDAAMTRTDPAPGNGGFLQGALGWRLDYWTVSAKLDRYSTFFNPENGLLAHDLPGTNGMTYNLDYYRDRPEGLFREIRGDLVWQERTTDDGQLQRRTTYAAGSIELREQQIRFGARYYAGPYRPVGANPGEWSNTINDDQYWNFLADFNTRSNRFGYGLSYFFGTLGGDDYNYILGYLWGRPTPSTFVTLNAEELRNFGTREQVIVTAGWDITPDHTISTRYINAYYGKAYRLAYTWHVRRDIDFFAVLDRFAGQPTALSAKIVMAY